MAFPTASLRHRYEAKDEVLYTDGDTLTQVTDQSGNLRHLDVVTGTPTWESLELNGHAVYRFDGSESVLRDRAGVDLTASALSVMVVAKANVEGSARTWVFGTYFSLTDIMAFTEGETASEWGVFARTTGTGAGTTQIYTSGVDTTEWAYLLFVWGSDTVSLYINGGFVTSAARAGTFDLSDIEMGDVVSAGGPFGGDIAAAATWEKALDATERGDLDDYIATTYGVPSIPTQTVPVHYVGRV